MPVTSKILWVVDVGDVDAFLRQAQYIGAAGVAIRTSNADMPSLVARCNEAGIRVYGWRWPYAQQAAAIAEANNAVSLITDHGMAGYFADPEGAPGQPWNWDQAGLQNLAEQFCSTIKQGAPAGRFGVTSHYMATNVFPSLPWAGFLKYADILLPQSYWRSTQGVIGHGNPGQNYASGISAWAAAGGARGLIVPMGGELGSSTPADIAAYGAAAKAAGITELHFYAYASDILQTVWDAVQRI